MMHKFDHARIILTVMVFVACTAALIALDIQEKKYDTQIQIMSDENATLQAQVLQYWNRVWEAEQELIELKSRDVLVECPVEYVTKIEYITKEVIREVEVYKSRLLNGFDTLGALETFLAEDKTDELRFYGADFPDGLGTCSMYSFQLSLAAQKEGLWLSWQILEPIEAERILGLEAGQGTWHMMNLAEVAGEFYLIEPQTDEIFYYAYWR